MYVNTNTWSVEKMILESTLVLVLLVSGELGREDHYNCYSNRQTHNSTYCGVVVLILTGNKISSFTGHFREYTLYRVHTTTGGSQSTHYNDYIQWKSYNVHCTHVILVLHVCRDSVSYYYQCGH